MSPTRSEIERMLAERLDFLIGVGHDMRAPLTGIAGFAAIISELDSVVADPTASEAAAYIRREAQRLVELLNQLLDFGQVEQGEPSLEREPLDLVRLARLAIEPWAALHPDLSFRLIHQGEVVVDGDFLKLHRIIANLIDNAIRHSPTGGTVWVEVSQEGDEVLVSVTDQGSGVATADRDRIFHRFVSLAGPIPGLINGLGIGLYVVKGLVEAHGGRVAVEDSEGARFVVRLPGAVGQVVPSH